MRTETLKTRNSAKADQVRSSRYSTPQHLHPVFQLQQKYGNQAVQRLLQSRQIQAKLTVGVPNDKYEQEADRVADHVMRMPDPKVQRESNDIDEDELEKGKIQAKPIGAAIIPVIQRLCPEFEEALQRQPLEEEKDEEEENLLQTKATLGQTPEVSNELESSINNLHGGGQPLSPSNRAFMDPRFGRDFSQVRIHTDSNAAQLARSINARAFTLGRDVVFGAGEYSSGASSGRRLLAHELTHVIQQSGDDVKRVQCQEEPGKEPKAAETTTPSPAEPTTDTVIENLDLATKAKAAAYALKAKHPTITFTSGRRSKNDQARAMASNVVLNRNWIKETYSNYTARRKCQEWLDNNPTVTTKPAIQTGLKTVLDSLTNAQIGALSKHLSGEAFDVQPVTENAAAIKADIRALIGIKKFLEREGGLTRWHAQF